MRLPKTIDKAIIIAYQDLKVMGVNSLAGKWQGVDDYGNYNMKVLYNYDIAMRVPERKVELEKLSHADLPWAEDHFQERIANEPANPGKAYKYWPYSTFKDGEDDDFKRHDGKFSHTYMERFYYTGLPQLIKLLSSNIHTRQAYFPIFYHGDLDLANLGDRIPCTLGYHFQYFGNRLNINYYIRSCDAFRHFHNDIYFTCRLLQYVSTELKVMPGNMYMYIANFHVFENDMYHIDKRLKKWKPV